jgi:hypothetical protein
MARVFDKTMLDALNMSPDTPLQITIHGGCMTVAPVNAGVSEEELAERIAGNRGVAPRQGSHEAGIGVPVSR